MEDNIAGLPDLMKRYFNFRVNEIEGRYLTYTHIHPLIESNRKNFLVKEIGSSSKGIPIHTITVGDGKIKILAWSQMHGNESTTTKAVFDLLQGFANNPEDPLIRVIMQKLTIKIIPMLNPDGALNYTRENGNKIDLNRDALRLKEIESKLLRRIFKEFNPDYCLNLHDQRTIFSAGTNPYPASLSFLTPAMDQKREIYPERIISMKIISSIVSDLRQWLPNEIGRYSDEYNPNCTGDTFQSLGKPTILFEAGHFPNDYQRETSRKFVMAALFSALSTIALENWKAHSLEEYYEIPENNKLFYDVILRNAQVNSKVVDIAMQFKEVLKDDKIEFQLKVEKIDETIGYYGHTEVDCENKTVTIEGCNSVSENVIVRNIYLNNEVLAINYQNI